MVGGIETPGLIRGFSKLTLAVLGVGARWLCPASVPRSELWRGGFLLDWPWSPWGPRPIQPLEVRTVGACEEAEPIPEGHPRVWGLLRGARKLTPRVRRQV